MCIRDRPYAVPEKIGDGAESRQTDLNGIPDKPCRKWRTVVWTGQFQYNPPQNDNGECNSERNEEVDSVFLPGWLAEKDTDQETQIPVSYTHLDVYKRQGGQLDPTRIDICDLSRTQQEPLLAKVRKRLRSQYGFTRNPKNKFGIDAVYSLEPVRYPGSGDDNERSSGVIAGLNPAGFGTTMAVTASFGLAAASYVLRRIAAV